MLTISPCRYRSLPGPGRLPRGRDLPAECSTRRSRSLYRRLAGIVPSLPCNKIQSTEYETTGKAEEAQINVRIYNCWTLQYNLRQKTQPWGYTGKTKTERIQKSGVIHASWRYRGANGYSYICSTGYATISICIYANQNVEVSRGLSDSQGSPFYHLLGLIKPKSASNAYLFSCWAPRRWINTSCCLALGIAVLQTTNMYTAIGFKLASTGSSVCSKRAM